MINFKQQFLQSIQEDRQEKDLLKDIIDGVIHLKHITSTEPFNFKWKYSNDQELITHIKSLYFYGRSGDLISRMYERGFSAIAQNNVSYTVYPIEIKFVRIPITYVAYPYFTKINIRPDLKYEELVQSLRTTRREFTMISVNQSLHNISSDINKLKNNFNRLNIVNKIDFNNPVEVVNALEALNIEHNDILKLKVKYGLPVSNAEVTDDLLSGIV